MGKIIAIANQKGGVGKNNYIRESCGLFRSPREKSSVD